MVVPSHFRDESHRIVDGSSSFTRSLTTADSKCQPLFILRSGRELGGLALALDVWFFCQFLTAIAYSRLTFGTISGTGVVFLAPYLAPADWGQVFFLSKMNGVNLYLPIYGC